MKILKFSEFINENNKNENLISLTIYYVTFHTSNSADNIYYGLDLEKAKIEFYSDSCVPERMLNNTDMSIEMSKIVNQYEFSYDGDIEDYPIEDYYTDHTVYKLVIEGDFEIIENRSIEAINSKSDELLSDVESYYKKEYGKYKYNIINVYDNEENYKGCIQLRIADHTENIHNNDRFSSSDCYISVVISNHDKTRKRFGVSNSFERRNNEKELIFDDDFIFDDVILEINETIEEFKNILIEK